MREADASFLLWPSVTFIATLASPWTLSFLGTSTLKTHSRLLFARTFCTSVLLPSFHLIVISQDRSSEDGRPMISTFLAPRATDDGTRMATVSFFLAALFLSFSVDWTSGVPADGHRRR